MNIIYIISKTEVMQEKYRQTDRQTDRRSRSKAGVYVYISVKQDYMSSKYRER
jgi:hypothetical protein